MLYEISLLLHSYTRWAVFIAMIGALGLAWWGVVRPRVWGRWEKRFAAAFAMLVSIQFVWGVLLYLVPEGLAQAALRDMGASMRVRELRFFGLEHPLQMFIAIGLVHMGWARSRKAPLDRTKFRWAAGAFTAATLLILAAIPWWRPQIRPIVTTDGVSVVAADVSVDVSGGDAERGAVLFAQSIGGQPACSTCHALDDTRIVGPGLQGIAVRAAERVPGQDAAAYLYTSIVDPAAHVVEGYANIMPPTFAAVLDEAQRRDLVAYMLRLDAE
ncbi:MAG: c-type cytochrome [bacterium]|nr:c-type cytochrome [bacterium]